jgi:hypothetical protein
MAVSFGELLSGAGRIGRRGEQVGQELRDYDRDRAALDELRRQQAYQAQISQLGLASQMAGVAPGAAVMTPGVQFGQPPVPEVAVPAAPAAPAAAPAPTSGGVRRMTPAEVARLKQDPYATGQVALTPDQIRQGYNRTALMKAPAAIADIVQAPVAGGLNLGSAAIYGAQNMVGEGMNYLFGTNMPTGVQAPQFSMTPFTDRFVTAPEQELKAGVRKLPPKPEAPAVRRMTPAEVDKLKQDPYATGTPTQPTKRALSYDNKVTPYDALMAQSAAQYGIDPVVFKRLIGTESSFLPDPPIAIGANGQRHIGIAQISDLHKLSDADRRNPAIAIPFAAQLLAREIQNTGGNVEEALMNYKGASSPKGRAAMSKPIGDILSGLTPSATPAAAAAPGAAPAAAPEAFKPAATPAKTADAAAKAASFGTMYGSGTVDASANNPQIQQVLTERQALVRQIQLMEQYGFGIQAMQLVPQVRAIDLGLMKSQADQGIYEGTTTGNFSRAMAVLSNFRGQPHQSLDRGDGTHDLYVGGKLARTGMTVEAMADFLNSNIDPAYRERKAALVAERAKQQMKIEEIAVDKVLTAKGNAEVATIQQMGAIAKVLAERKGVKATLNTNNNTILVQETDDAGNTRVFLVNPTGTKTEMRGKVVESPLRTQIYGSR